MGNCCHSSQSKQFNYNKLSPDFKCRIKPLKDINDYDCLFDLNPSDTIMSTNNDYSDDETSQNPTSTPTTANIQTDDSDDSDMTYNFMDDLNLSSNHIPTKTTLSIINHTQSESCPIPTISSKTPRIARIHPIKSNSLSLRTFAPRQPIIPESPNPDDPIPCDDFSISFPLPLFKPISECTSNSNPYDSKSRQISNLSKSPSYNSNSPSFNSSCRFSTNSPNQMSLSAEQQLLKQLAAHKSCDGFELDAQSDAISDSMNHPFKMIPFDEDSTDEFYKLQQIEESALKLILMNEDIIYDSLLKIYSSERQQYIDVAAILTENQMYFSSSIKYQIWIEFMKRSKIQKLINSVQNNEEKSIDITLAAQIIKNMELTENDPLCTSKMVKYLMNKTKKQIKLDILLNERNIQSLSALFELESDIVKDVNSIVIENFFNPQMMQQQQRENFLHHLLDGMPFIDQDRERDSIIIIFKQYYSASSIIPKLTKRMEEYLNLNELSNITSLSILPACDKNNVSKNIPPTVLIADLSVYKTINLWDIDEGYVFILSDNQNNDDITCLLTSNNTRFEWVTHLDYVLNGHVTNNDEEYKNDTNTKHKMFNDFTDTDCKDDGEFSTHFNFGIYLNYWQRGFENSVIPNYETLKDELLKNKISKIVEKDYYKLYKQCMEILTQKGYKLNAQHIGINNKQFNIPIGTKITINHVISLKVYTDFDELQREFKKQCRKCNENETEEKLAERNSEIAHWCRYIKESCSFYGTLMKTKTFYSGLKTKLLFHSMTQRFECMLSTTSNVNIANNFGSDHGIVLKLKAANSKTKCFDMSRISNYQHEQEKLIMGSSLKICDIYINAESTKTYIAALQLFEQIMNGSFVDFKENVELELYGLIMCYLENKALKINNKTVSKYIMALFGNMTRKMQKMSEENKLWMNQHTLQQIKHQKLNELFKTNQFFNYFNINISNIHWVQQFVWDIKEDEYIKFIKLKPRKYIESIDYLYVIGNVEIVFRLKCCANYSDISTKCALFLVLVELPENIEGITVEYHVLCDKNKTIIMSSTPQWLSMDNNCCGSQSFSSNCLNSNASIRWILGIKVIEIKNNVN